jgi:FkbM family methyltransferase
MIADIWGRIGTAADLAQKRHWSLFAAKTCRMLGWEFALHRLTCAIQVPGEPSLRKLRVYMELGDWISDAICRSGQWEPTLTRAIVAHARQGGLLVDVGANFGYYSLLWAAARPDNRVFAIEASPRVLAKLTRNVRLNRLQDQVHIVQLALADRDGVGYFAPGPEAQTGWGGLTNNQDAATISTELARLDTRFASLPYIHVLKIDAEGGDTLVLRGAEQLLRKRRIGAVYYEQITDRMADLGIDADEAAKLLGRYGYAVSCVYRADDGRVSEWQALPT